MKKVIFFAVILLSGTTFLVNAKVKPGGNVNCPSGTSGYCVGVWDAEGYATYSCKDPGNSNVTKDCQ